MELATLAGGCFWCLQHDFEAIPGVQKTTCGYAGGNTIHPTYEEVSEGSTGHVEAVQIEFDPEKIDFTTLLSHFWHMIDPTREEGQFSDRGTQYRPVIFYHDARQRELADRSRKELITRRKDLHIRVKIQPFTSFFPAEAYHQQFAEKNPQRYTSYQCACGRKERLKELWG